MKDKRITLIIPRDLHSYEPMVYPPLNLLYIASILQRNRNNKVQIFDMREEGCRMKDIPESDFYGLTSTTSQINDVKEVSNYLRTERKGFTILGGPHATWLPKDVIQDFTTVVMGEGEGVIEDIINNKIRGMIYSNPIKNIDEIPYPARNLLPQSKIISEKLWEGYGYGKGSIATTIISSRGCNFNCRFCANLPIPVRFRSPENFVNEIERIVEDYGCKHFRFLDDNFIQNKKRLEEICNKLGPLNIHFRCSGRSKTLDEETCNLLKNGGCSEIGFGVEVADNDILKLLNKRETVSDHKKAIENAHKYGLKSKVFLMIGLPKETWETIESNKRFMEETQPDKWVLTLFTPYPGGQIWANPDKYGIKILENDFSKYAQSSDSSISIIKTDVATTEELNEHYKNFFEYLKSNKWRVESKER